jgi:hypothetical protein
MWLFSSGQQPIPRESRMALPHPTAVFNAASNVEAHLVQSLLMEAGIEAFAVDDVSMVGVWAFGHLPEIHKPQVFVDRANADRAREVIEAYDSKAMFAEAAARQQSFCYSCGDAVEYGTPTCPACGSPLDWDEDG